VTIDLAVMEATIRRVQAHLDRHGVGNRQHVKTHKIPAIDRMQVAAGAVGITVQKVARRRCSPPPAWPTRASDLQRARAGEVRHRFRAQRRQTPQTVLNSRGSP
jgi:hypothetical protein